MRNVCLGLAVAAALILAPAPAALGGAPDFEVREGSVISILALGGEIDIAPQFLPMAPAQDPGFEMRSLDSLQLSRYETAFEEYVDLFTNQELQVDLDSGTGVATAEFPLWVIDSDGNRVELPMTLTTGVPSTITCGGWPFCIGIPSDPDYCAGSAWDTQSGELRLVGVVLVPDDSGLTIECSGIVLKVEATISPDDTDGDGELDALDNCPDHFNSTQADDDGALDDGIGDICDNCPDTYNPTQADNDADGAGNSCDPLRVNYQPDASAVPSGYVKDTGAPYSQVTDRGWMGATLPNRDRAQGGDQRLETFVFASSVQTWQATLHPACYDLSLAVGDTKFPQGPHRVVTEGILAVDDESTAAGEYLLADVEDSYVTDGRLTVTIGGAGGSTMFDYIDITESGSQPFFARFVNFQPSTSTVPDGFEEDHGLVYDSGRGYGWNLDMSVLTRDRGTLGDPVLDTAIFTNSARSWELDLPADFHDVVISVGDAAFPQGPHKVVVEGETWLEAESTATGEFLTLTGRVLVLDGKLSVTIGDGGGSTFINYVAVTSTPRDLDEDGVPNLVDNCFELANPGQGDIDGDGVGDLCSPDSDGDGYPDPLDNCPGVPNPDQADTDYDQHGDVCDCAPGNAFVHAPAVEVSLLRVGAVEGSPNLLAWTTQVEESGLGTRYDLASGMLSDLHEDAGFADAICVQSDLIPAQYEDSRSASPGDGFYYLVRGDNECDPPGSYGPDDAAARSLLDSSSPCP